MSNVTRKVLQDKPRRDGTASVMIRITKSRLHAYLGTSVYVSAKNFNPEGTYDSRNWVRRSYPDHLTANGMIKALLDRIQAVITRYAELGQTHYTAEEIKAAVEGTTGNSFSGFVQKQIAVWETKEQFSNVRNHSSMLTNLRRFLGRDALQPIYFGELTAEKVREFETYLLTRPLKRATTEAKRRNTTTDYLRRLHQHITAYITAHRLPNEADPLRNVILPMAPVDRHRLTEAEIDLWMTAELPTGGKWTTATHARNLYICCYAIHGIRGGDLLQARVDQFQQVWQMEAGKAVQRWRFFYTSDKKDLSKSVLLEEPVLTMLLTYTSGKNAEDLVFPFLKPRPWWDAKTLDEKINAQIGYIDRLLRLVASHLEIKKNPTIHTARHAFAEHLYDIVGDIRVVQQALGHKSILTTERYITAMKQTTVDKANALYGRWAKPAIPEPEQEVDNIRKLG